jgi:hypothetical protein
MAEDKPSRAQKVSNSDNQTYVPVHHKRWFWPTAGIIVVLILIFGFLARLRWAWHGGPGYRLSRTGDLGARPFGHARIDHFGGMGDGQLDSQNRLQGVVTAVNGSIITVAGHGSTNIIQTNGSTSYQNGNQIKINDSVIAFGATSSGTFTATRVVINP